MRAVVLKQGVEYIELQPNVELAQRIMKNQPVEGTTSQFPREARWVLATDNRTHRTSDRFPFRAVAFSEGACTGTKIGARTMLTAAHCVYDTVAFPQGWICNNGGVSPLCNAPRPRWRFKAEGEGGFTPWLPQECEQIWIQWAFVQLTQPVTVEDTWYFAAHDVAVVDLSGCSDHGNTGWLGTIPMSDNDLSNWSGKAWRFGYPARAPCPEHAAGNYQDCPGEGAWPGSTWRYSSTPPPPISGAELWGASSYEFGPGYYYGAGTLWSAIDTTLGDSGSALYIALPGWDRRVIGVWSFATSSDEDEPANAYMRWTAWVHNWVAAVSDFPEDTY
jgi:hypothetical protein